MNITLTILELIAIILASSGVTAGVISFMNDFLHRAEAPKVITNEKAKEVCCKNCYYREYDVTDPECFHCSDHDNFKQTG